LSSPELRERLTFLLQEQVPAVDRDAFLAGCADRWAIPIEEVDFLLYAIDSYHLKNTVLSGARVHYDSHFERIFRELDAIHGRRPPTFWQRMLRWF
jgi:hypothetical protein